MFNSVMYYCVTVLMSPFVRIYTSGAKDINYINMMLAYLVGLHGIASAFRIPYNIVVSSHGFFKETWKQPVICAALSVVISCVFGKYEYAFILLGPIVFYFANFLYQHFKIRSLAPHLISGNAFIMLAISLIGFAGSIVVSAQIPDTNSIAAWFVLGVVSLAVSVVFVMALSAIFLPKEIRATFEYIKQHIKRRKTND